MEATLDDRSPLELPESLLCSEQTKFLRFTPFLAGIGGLDSNDSRLLELFRADSLAESSGFEL